MEDDHDARHDGPLERHCRQGTPPITRRVYEIPVFFGVTARSDAKRTISCMALNKGLSINRRVTQRGAAHPTGLDPRRQGARQTRQRSDSGARDQALSADFVHSRTTGYGLPRRYQSR
jgi:hypothetical protein